MYALSLFVLTQAAAQVGEPSATVGDVPTSTLTYQVLDEPEALYVLIKPTSALGFLAHEHVVEARGYSGSISYNPEDPKNCVIKIDVPVASLLVDRPAFRKTLGINKGISAKDRKKVDRNMRHKKQLHQSEFPLIRFRSTSCVLDKKPGQFTVVGNLEIRGVKAKISTKVDVKLDGDKLYARSDFSEVHESFGFKPYSAFGGLIKNHRLLSFRVRLQALRSPPAKQNGL